MQVQLVKKVISIVNGNRKGVTSNMNQKPVIQIFKEDDILIHG